MSVGLKSYEFRRERQASWVELERLTAQAERSGVRKPWWNRTTSSRVIALRLASQPMGGWPSGLSPQNQRVMAFSAITEGSLLSEAISPSASSFFRANSASANVGDTLHVCFHDPRRAGCDDILHHAIGDAADDVTV